MLLVAISDRPRCTASGCEGTTQRAAAQMGMFNFVLVSTGVGRPQGGATHQRSTSHSPLGRRSSAKHCARRALRLVCVARQLCQASVANHMMATASGPNLSIIIFFKSLFTSSACLGERVGSAGFWSVGPRLWVGAGRRREARRRLGWRRHRLVGHDLFDV